ncbi:alkaline phosphatase family protein [Steroidobacter sp. S1-65]|uniref:Alkaline phosphatase family protein n=1 Tax=Steroidobacter gossypii TaxID=2805490 RepID=A0ABS1X344_9GAMM|nr:alkaline phosphatase family protein [Steroidobacter gossypii]MBM0107636.1 alkaline phosphatase family protein [Steroidobacter gossypii]
MSSTPRRAIARCLSTCLLFGALAPLQAAESPQPKLVVAIAVDQLSSDVFTEYRPLYQAGLKRLAGGVVFPRGHQSHAATETCPGHSTILTGTRPARSGIIANDWVVPSLPRTINGRQTFSVYCVEKPGPAGSSTDESTLTPDTLLVPTLGDRMKARDPATRVVSVAGKDRAAVMLGGHNADLTLWWTSEGFRTYDGRQASIPKSIAETLNADMRKSYSQPTVPKLPAACASRSRELKLSEGVSIGTLQRLPGNSRRWRATPAMDAFTVDAALAAAKSFNLGRNESIDLLAVSLSGTDYTGHYYGTEGAEMCTQQLALDQSLGRLLAGLDKMKVPYVVAMTADHGGADATERNRARGVVAVERIDPSLQPVRINAALAADFPDLPKPLVINENYFANDIYLNANLPAERRAAVLEATAQMYRRHPQVAAVFTKNELIAAEPPSGPVDEWTLLDRAKASFNAQRSGDLIVLLKPYVSLYYTPENPETDYSSSHGSAWGYDRRVPIVFWWHGVNGFQQPAAVETVDIAPTLAKLIGLDVPAAEFDGRALPVVQP